MTIARYVICCGTAAGFATLAAMTVSARGAGKHPLQPVNATSHWLHGEKAAAVRRADLAHTGPALITHFASCAFWALPFARWLVSRPPRSPLHMLGEASLLSAFAAAFDYGVVPKRLTPGWELALPGRAVAAIFAAMAVGLAAGGLAAQDKHPS